MIVVRGEPDRAATGVVTAAVHGTSDLDRLLIAAAETHVRNASLRLLSVSNVLTYVGRFTTMVDSVGEITEEKEHETAAMADRIRNRGRFRAGPGDPRAAAPRALPCPDRPARLRGDGRRRRRQLNETRPRAPVRPHRRPRSAPLVASHSTLSTSPTGRRGVATPRGP